MNRKWLSIILVFFFVQFLFFLIDGTRFEPRLNDSGNIMSRFAQWITETKLVTEWFTLYSYPYFNLVTLVFLIVIIINLISDITHKKRMKIIRR